jgi:Meiotically up-regulated gene 113
VSDVYLIGALDSSIAKIGTSRNVSTRLAALQTGSPTQLHVLATAPGGAPLEHALHAHFQDCRLQGEWFDFGKQDRVIAFHAAIIKTGRATARDVRPDSEQVTAQPQKEAAEPYIPLAQRDPDFAAFLHAAAKRFGPSMSGSWPH